VELRTNTFKQRLADRSGAVQYGLFVSLADPVCAEIAATSNLDWLIIDTEHAPNDVRSTMTQLQATLAYDVEVVVRPYVGDRALIKRLLDIGAESLLIPMVDTAEQAEDLVRAVRYPPEGVRGVSSARAARWSRVDGYFAGANAQICLIAQIESQAGLDNLSGIAGVEGIDGLFVGPSDLAAALGHLGNPGHPDVQAAVIGAIESIVAAGKPAGVYGATPDAAQRYADAGATFVMIGVDTIVLAKSIDALVAQFK